jgi:integrase/recombinase XerD
MECGTKDLQRLPHGMVGRGLAVYRDRVVSARKRYTRGQVSPLSSKGIQKKLERYAKAADIKASCHSLRHTFASNLLEAGAEVIAIKELLGHASIQSSERYAKLSNQRVKQAYQQAMRKVMAKTRV